MSENPLRSLTATGVVIVAGKGGVGKTTVTAVLARAASAAGRRVLAVELDGKAMLGELLAGEPPVGGLRPAVQHISAPDALEEYLREHGFRRIAKRLNRTGVIDMVGTAAPGIDDIVVLGKIKQLERTGEYDLVLVDGPAAGHAVTFLTSASGLADAVRGGPVRRQADDVLELLGDADRCSVVLVTLPETTPVNETIETAFALEDEVGVRLGPVVVNGVDVRSDLPTADAVATALDSDIDGLGSAARSALVEAADFRRSRIASETDALAQLGDGLPLPQVRLPQLARAGLTSADITDLAMQLSGMDQVRPGETSRSDRVENGRRAEGAT